MHDTDKPLEATIETSHENETDARLSPGAGMRMSNISRFIQTRGVGYIHNFINLIYVTWFVIIGICPVVGFAAGNLGLSPDYGNFLILLLTSFIDIGVTLYFLSDKKGEHITDFVITLTEICYIGFAATIISFVTRILIGVLFGSSDPC